MLGGWNWSTRALWRWRNGEFSKLLWGFIGRLGKRFRRSCILSFYVTSIETSSQPVDEDLVTSILTAQSRVFPSSTWPNETTRILLRLAFFNSLQGHSKPLTVYVQRSLLAVPLSRERRQCLARVLLSERQDTRFRTGKDRYHAISEEFSTKVESAGKDGSIIDRELYRLLAKLARNRSLYIIWYVEILMRLWWKARDGSCHTLGWHTKSEGVAKLVLVHTFH